MSELYTSGVLPASHYYIHTYYVPTYYYAYITLEKWIAAKIFRNDLSRVFMSSNDYAFRRRFELTDMSQAYDEIGASSLRFPFANYNILNQGWTRDEREAANTAAQVYAGLYVGTTKLQAAAVTAEIPVQFYFDREDDARLAYDNLFFYSFNPHYYKASVPYGNSTLELPYAFELTNLVFNPTFTEQDWLKQNRIFVITVNFRISSYIIKPPLQPDWNASAETLREYGSAKEYDPGESRPDGIENYVLTEDVILDFWSKDLDLKVMNYAGTESFPHTGEEGVIYVDTLCPDQSKGFLDQPVTRKCDIYRWNSQTQGYTQIDPLKQIDISLDAIGVNGELASGSVAVRYLRLNAVTSTTAEIAWDYDLDYDPAQIRKITVAVNDPKTEIEIPVDSKSYLLKALAEGSNYLVYVNFYSTDGSVKRLHLTLTTQAGESVKDQVLPKNALVGLNWDLD